MPKAAKPRRGDTPEGPGHAAKPLPGGQRNQPAHPARPFPDALLDNQLLINLQKTAGNKAVCDLVQRQAVPRRPARLLGQDVKRDPQRAPASHAALPARGFVVQRDIGGSFLTARGGFDIDMQTQQGALTGAGASGLKGTIKFTPDKTSPYTNKLGLIQIVKHTDVKGTSFPVASVPAARRPLLETKEDKAAGVEGGFFTDVLHQNFGVSPPAERAQGSEVLPYYEGSTPVFGFRRSENPDDIKATELFDFPGNTSKTADLDFRFETVAKGDDNLQVYGAVKWGFGLRHGKVVDETISISDDASQTFEAALEKHRDFYVHEPVTFYFGFDQDTLLAGEADKIDTFLDYLRRFPDVQLNLTGFADLRGRKAYNLDLARRRSDTLAQELLTRGVDSARITVRPPVGVTTEFTKDAITPQQSEANRRGNRRVMINFEHTASVLPGGGP